MKNLKEIIYILRQNNLHPMISSAKSGEKHSKMAQLYQGIEDGHFNSDEEAEASLYFGKTGVAAYRKLKSDLKEKLLGTLLQIDPKGEIYSDYQKAYYECHKEWLTVKILAGQNANNAAMDLAVKLWKQAEKFEFSLLCMDILAYMRLQYSFRLRDKKKAMETGRQSEYYRQVYEWESLAEQLYADLMVDYVDGGKTNHNSVKMACLFYERLEPALARFNSYRLHMYGRLIGLMRYSMAHQHQDALGFCEDAIVFFQAKPYEARVPLQVFYYHRLICNVHLKQFEKGRASADYCLGMLKEGTYNWFKYKELYFTLALHTRQYQQASDLLVRVLEHPRFQYLPEENREIWRIYESYIFYLAHINKIRAPSTRAFKLSKLMNETPLSSRDKTGINVMILIVKILLLIADNKYGKLLDEVEAMEQYCYRHLNGRHTERMYNFIRLLLQIPLGNFDVRMIEKKALRYLQKMQTIQPELSNQTHGIEIIPYEDLWEMAIESVRNYPKKAFSNRAVA